jgi:hydrogenase expression/formation protein HypC
MCLGIPGRVLGIGGDALRTSRVGFGDVIKSVSLAYVPEAEVGDYVIVHVGVAISRIDAAEAERVFSYLEQIDELMSSGDSEHNRETPST